MKKLIFVLSVLFLCVLCFLYFRNPSNTNSINWYNGSISDASTMNGKKLIMVNFHKDWWSACKLLDANTFSNSNVSKYLNQNFINLKVDADGEYIYVTSRENFNISSGYEIKEIKKLLIKNNINCRI